MSSRHRPYPHYRDSGIEWLGQIPSHWEVRRLKTIADVRPSGVDKHSLDNETPVRLCNYTDVYYNELIIEELELMEATVTAEELRRFELRAGDVLITKDSETPDDIAVSAYVPSDLPGVVCGYHLALIRPENSEMDGRYLFRSFSARPIATQFEVAANGITRYGLSASAIGGAWFALPPLDEQRAIADFLDRETARLDALITAKRRLIELLKEKRAALLSHVVTRGLDPSAPLRDSGIEWLGEIPSHWDLSQLRFIAESLQTGPFGSQLHSDEYISGGIPVINPSHMVNGRIIPDWDITVDEETWGYLSRHALEIGDIIFARRGELGRSALVTEAEAHWLTGTGSLRVRLIKALVNPQYLNEFLDTQFVSDWLLLESVGSTMDNLNTSILGRLPVIVPPMDEQETIIQALASSGFLSDQLVSITEETINALIEYRTALIASAVTGQIDVRE